MQESGQGGQQPQHEDAHIPTNADMHEVFENLQPIRELELALMASPTFSLYLTASDSSPGLGEVYEPWRMTVPEFDDVIESWEDKLKMVTDIGGERAVMEEEFRSIVASFEAEMGEDPSPNTLVPWSSTLLSNGYVHGERDEARAETGWPQDGHVYLEADPLAGDHEETGHDPLPDSYAGVSRLGALKENQTRGVDKDTTNSSSFGTAHGSPIKRLCPWGNYPSTPDMGTLEDVIKGTVLRSEIEGVVAKVERALVTLPSSSNNKKIRRTVNMAAEEVREFTKKMEEADKVEGISIKGGEAVVILSSESSDEEERARKRKGDFLYAFQKMAPVSSRLRPRGTPKQQPKSRSAVELIKRIREIRRAREETMAKRRKEHANEPNTKLSLAPPIQGAEEK